MEKFTTTDGESIHVEILGEGRPLIFLHGWTANHTDWLKYAEALADDHCCYCWDARGHGGHRLTSDSPVTVERMAKDLNELIGHFSLEQPIVLGHSMGALTTWEYVHQFGCSKLSKLCLVDQSPKLLTSEDWLHGIYGTFDEQYNQQFIGRLESDFAEAVLLLAAEGNNPRTAASYEANTAGFQQVREYLAKLAPEPLIQVWKSLSLVDYREVLPRITVPTMLVHGDESQFYSVELANYVQQAIPNAVLHVYERTDHSPHMWQKARFIEDLKAFTAS